MTTDPGAGDDVTWLLDRLEEVMADRSSPSGEPVSDDPEREHERSH